MRIIVGLKSAAFANYDLVRFGHCVNFAYRIDMPLFFVWFVLLPLVGIPSKLEIILPLPFGVLPLNERKNRNVSSIRLLTFQ